MSNGQREWAKFMLRLPPDVRAWIAAQAEANACSQNSEIVRAIRERMERRGVETTVRAA